MVGGSAGHFKDVFTIKAFATDPTTSKERGFGTFKDFLKEFNEAFTLLDLVDHAITNMKALTLTGTADEYVAEFRPLAIQSGITKVAILSDYFLTGLTPSLVRSIMRVENLPTTIDAYYILATRLDLQWRKGLELTEHTETFLMTSPDHQQPG